MARNEDRLTVGSEVRSGDNIVEVIHDDVSLRQIDSPYLHHREGKTARNQQRRWPLERHDVQGIPGEHTGVSERDAAEDLTRATQEAILRDGEQPSSQQHISTRPCEFRPQRRYLPPRQCDQPHRYFHRRATN